jgi:hypothetical protein
MAQTANERRYSVWANLRWFSLLFMLSFLAASALSTMLAPYAPTFSFWLVPVVLLVGAFALAASLSAKRIAERNPTELTSKRLSLSAGYALIATTITFAPVAILLALQFFSAPASPEASHALVGAVFGALTTAAIATPINFIVAWLILGHAQASRPRQ